MPGLAPFLVLLAQPAPVIDLITMGPGDYVFSSWGHSAICVTELERARCYNYGTADFSTPGPLTIDFLRGRARFWVSVVPPDPMFEAYRREDRTVWRQRLPLTSTQAIDLALRLEASAAEEVRYYRYHHFLDNCTTRIRDHIDAVTRGALHEVELLDAPTTFRAEARRGFASVFALEVATDLLLGRATDPPITSWQYMFLPTALMRAVELKLGASPEVVYLRKGPGSKAPSSAASRSLAIAVCGFAFAALVFLLSTIGRRARLAGLGLGSLGLVLWSFALFTTVPELRFNELFLVVVPFDLALVFLSEPKQRLYLLGRKLQLVLVLLLGLFGILISPLWPAVLAVTLVLVAVRRGSGRPIQGEGAGSSESAMRSA